MNFPEPPPSGVAIIAGEDAPPRPRVTFDIPDGADRGECRSCGTPVAWIITARALPRRGALSEAAMKPKVFCWVNSGHGTDWQSVLAMAEDGHVLAEHVSSHEEWAKHDIGITSDWKHEAYAAHYPDGYELVWVDDARPGHCPGLDAAYQKNQARRREAEAAQ